MATPQELQAQIDANFTEIRSLGAQIRALNNTPDADKTEAQIQLVNQLESQRTTLRQQTGELGKQLEVATDQKPETSKYEGVDNNSGQYRYQNPVTGISYLDPTPPTAAQQQPSETGTTYEELQAQIDAENPPGPLTGIATPNTVIGSDAKYPTTGIFSNPTYPEPMMDTTTFDSSEARLKQSNLKNKITQKTKKDPNVVVNSGVIKTGDDWRLRVSLAPNSKVFYKSSNTGILNPLKATDGAIFPYTPAVSISHAARYAETKLTHSNYASYFYEGSEVSAVTISGDFTVQTVAEGRYLLAVISFFRSATKMWFGNQDQSSLIGSPPPLLYLNGYGKNYFPNVPVLLTSFQHTMPADVDYIDIGGDLGLTTKGPTTGTYGFKYGGAAGDTTSASTDTAHAESFGTRVPTNSQISITLQPVYSRKRIHEQFNLDQFASGSLLTGGFI